MLRTLAGRTRHFLSFDGRDGGRTTEVFGDLSRAERIAVLVPGSDTGLDKYAAERRSTATAEELGGSSSGGAAAVVAWLGYRTPGTVSPKALTPGLADDTAPGLRRFIRELAATKPTARISLLCHSYGSVVCGRAASGLDVATSSCTAAPAPVSATPPPCIPRPPSGPAGADGDWIADVPHTRASTSPSSPSDSVPTRSRRSSAPGSSTQATAATATT